MYNPLYKPSVHFIFHFLFHLILHYTRYPLFWETPEGNPSLGNNLACHVSLVLNSLKGVI